MVYIIGMSGLLKSQKPSYGKLKVESRESGIVLFLEFDQFPPQIRSFDLSISTCD